MKSGVDVSGWFALRGNKIACRMAGVVVAVAGAVILIRAVPISLWLLALIALVLLLLALTMPGEGGRRK
jgi:hypothetical protein